MRIVAEALIWKERLPILIFVIIGIGRAEFKGAIIKVAQLAVHSCYAARIVQDIPIQDSRNNVIWSKCCSRKNCDVAICADDRLVAPCSKFGRSCVAYVKIGWFAVEKYSKSSGGCIKKSIVIPLISDKLQPE